MRAICPNHKNHKRFVTVVQITQEWIVDEIGDFIEVSHECLETKHGPRERNTWTCCECGTEAVVQE
ncbi:hypothetical protein IMZ31_23325 (plasmid) [Pontibacillus sp. ALD_SL1]|uniref:hypothetical protein n=1 Tax=Pontibacillus sp. ALD_SL1 TaxID=2777185 RepID=UPI001A95A8F4|nr:hypothetical protein [Pontibacillus sp. ALD_SL1]QST02384.1 hypothetical protein IMZ31_23325 [Pontibacillus sp. ALD_SL1]